MPTTAGGINYKELTRASESAVESYAARDPSGWGATRVFRVLWTERQSFIVEFLGGVTPAGIYTPPATYPAITNLVALTATVRGMPSKSTATGPSSMAEYPYAEVTINYAIPEGESDDQELGNITENIDVSVEIMTMTEGEFRWVTNAEVFDESGVSVGNVQADEADHPVKEAPGKPMPSVEYSLDISHHTNPPWTAILNKVGMINSSIFSPLSKISFAARTLLFGGVTTRRTIVFNPESTDIEFVESYNLAYKFIFRRVPWDLTYKPKLLPDNGSSLAGWSKLQDTRGQPVFESTSFQPLIQ